MDPVMVDWLTLILAPIGLVLLLVSVLSRRSARKAGTPPPAHGQVCQILGAVCVMLVAVLQFVTVN